jgi:hypothetical protein
MDENLKFFLENQPTNVKELARLTGRSATWVRDNLKKFGVPCRKDETGTNIFFLVPTDQAERVAHDAGEPETPETQVETPPEEPTSPKAPENADTKGSCPLCESTTDQIRAGDTGFLAAALTCPDCGGTYNEFTGKEIVALKAQGDKPKRRILNPQYKITAKVEAVKAAGGSLSYDKGTKTWELSMDGWGMTLTAQTFAALTPETILNR